MKKKLLYVAVGVIGLLVVLVIAAPFLIDANRFRPTIEARLGSALGRTVRIGDLSLSLWSGGLRAREISIGDDPKFGQAEFLRAKSLDVGVEILPLLRSRSLRVTGVTLNEPEIVLLRSAAGRWNFSSLGAGGSKTPAGASTKRDVSIQELKIAGGKLTVGDASSRQKATTYSDVDVTARNLSYVSQFPFTLSASTPGGGHVKIEGTAGPLNRTDAARTPLQAEVTARNVDLGATGFIDPASGMGGLLDYTGTVKSDGKTARLEGAVKAEDLRLTRTATPAKVPVTLSYATDYDLGQRTGVLSRGEVRTGGAVAHLSGPYNRRGSSTTVRLKLTGSKLPVSDLEGLLPALGVVLPRAVSLQGGTADADLAIEGPLDHLVTNGDVNLSGARLKGFDLASRMSALSALAGTKGGSDTLIETFASKLRVAADGIRADDLRLVVPGIGTMTGRGTIGANNALDFHLVASLADGGQGSLLGAVASRLGRGTTGTIPFMIQGTTSAPVFVPDVGSMVSDGLVDSLQQQGEKPEQPDVGEILGGLLGRKRK